MALEAIATRVHGAALSAGGPLSWTFPGTRGSELLLTQVRALHTAYPPVVSHQHLVSKADVHHNGTPCEAGSRHGSTPWPCGLRPPGSPACTGSVLGICQRLRGHAATPTTSTWAPLRHSGGCATACCSPTAVHGQQLPIPSWAAVQLLGVTAGHPASRQGDRCSNSPKNTGVLASRSCTPGPWPGPHPPPRNRGLGRLPPSHAACFPVRLQPAGLGHGDPYCPLPSPTRSFTRCYRSKGETASSSTRGGSSILVGRSGSSSSRSDRSGTGSSMSTSNSSSCRCYHSDADRPPDGWYERASLTDLTRPASLFPNARAIRRKIVAHLGPTNSGKTHAALKALRAAESGLYCGPLRLLACEIADRLIADGLPCHLVTGQEVRLAPGDTPARHTSCTVEMAMVSPSSYLNRPNNLDEVQYTPTSPGGTAASGSASASYDASDPYSAAAAASAASYQQSYGGGGDEDEAPAVLDVAVLDEIQMLGDLERGWAWTRALLGLAAREVHVAGDPGALPLLRRLAEECGDELEVIRYQRLSPLVVESSALVSVGEVRPGDCLVGFSRRSLHALRREVMRRKGQEACLVYGGLPPDARRQQAALFNRANRSPPEQQQNHHHTQGADTPRSTSGAGPGAAGAQGTAHGNPSSTDGPSTAEEDQDERLTSWLGSNEDSSSSSSDPASSPGSSASSSAPPSAPRVLCASDAIGMGLNLHIRRVVFTTMRKFDGRSVRQLQASEVRQIAGRAGRFSLAHPSGFVTTLHARDLPALHAALREPPQPVTRACLLPSSEDLVAYAARHPDRPFALSMAAFAAEATVNEQSYVYGNYESAYYIASALRHLEERMSLEDMVLFSTAPADMEDTAVSSALLRFAELYCGEQGVVGHEAISSSPLPDTAPSSEAELKRLEELHRVYDLYIWLSYRLPYAFTGRTEAEGLRAACGELIEEGLERLVAEGLRALGRRGHHAHGKQGQHGEACEHGGEEEVVEEVEEEAELGGGRGGYRASVWAR